MIARNRLPLRESCALFEQHHVARMPTLGARHAVSPACSTDRAAIGNDVEAVSLPVASSTTDRVAVVKGGMQVRDFFRALDD